MADISELLDEMLANNEGMNNAETASTTDNNDNNEPINAGPSAADLAILHAPTAAELELDDVEKNAINNGALNPVSIAFEDDFLKERARKKRVDKIKNAGFWKMPAPLRENMKRLASKKHAEQQPVLWSLKEEMEYEAHREGTLQGGESLPLDKVQLEIWRGRQPRAILYNAKLERLSTAPSRVYENTISQEPRSNIPRPAASGVIGARVSKPQKKARNTARTTYSREQAAQRALEDAQKRAELLAEELNETESSNAEPGEYTSPFHHRRDSAVEMDTMEHFGHD